MKRVLVAVAFIATTVFVPTVGAHAAPATGQVTIAQMATYSSGSNFELTVCVDGTSVKDDMASGTVLDPMAFSVGVHDIAFVQGTDCTAEPFVDGTFTVTDGGNSTVMSYWGSDDRGVAQFDNDESCIPNGTTRLTVRNAASTDGPVNFLVTPQGGTEQTVVSNLALGEQKQGSVAAGVYSDGRYTETAGGATIIDIGGETLHSGENGTLYLYGGNDGSVGSHFTSEILPICEVPITHTSPPETTTTTAAVAAVVVTPHFTG